MRSPAFVAEFTVNHLGNLNLLFRMVDEAVDSGCDYIKMQRKDVRSFYTEEELRRPFRSPYGSTYGEYRTLFEFDLADIRRFDRKCSERGIPWFITVQDESSLEGLAEFNLPMYKIASSNLRKVPFLHRVDQDTPPEAAIVLSSGGATVADIDAALTVFSDRRIHLLHCVSQYPCSPERVRLGNITALQRLFGSDRVTVGYSGHEEGFTVTLAAADLGATMIERHFCVSRDSFVHHIACALEPAEFRQMVDLVRSSEPLKSRYESLPSETFTTAFGMTSKESRFLIDRRYGEPIQET
jgi:N-acetylneuraminate synthase